MFVKKKWKNRYSEYPGRRLLVDVNTGEQKTVDVSRSEGVVYEVGDPFSAPNMDFLEERISEKSSNTVFNNDGSITETFANGDVQTTVFGINDITETYVEARRGITMTVVTTFEADGSISKAVSYDPDESTEGDGDNEWGGNTPEPDNPDIPDVDINASKVQQAKQIVQQYLESLEVSNETTQAEVEEGIIQQLSLAELPDVQVTVVFEKENATTESDGSVSISVTLTIGDASESVSVEKVIDSLPQPEIPDTDIPIYPEKSTDYNESASASVGSPFVIAKTYIYGSDYVGVRNITANFAVDGYNYPYAAKNSKVVFCIEKSTDDELTYEELSRTDEITVGRTFTIPNNNIRIALQADNVELGNGDIIRTAFKMLSGDSGGVTYVFFEGDKYILNNVNPIEIS